MAEGGGLENRFTRDRDGGSNPSPSAILNQENQPILTFVSLTPLSERVRIALAPSALRRGAGVADQGRLLSDCADKHRYRGFESHPLRHISSLPVMKFMMKYANACLTNIILNELFL